LKAAIASCVCAKFALLIGAKDNLREDPETNLQEGSIDNCNLMKDALLTVDPSWIIVQLLGEEASKDNILAHVHGLVDQASKAPARNGFDGQALPLVALVYFAGHGIQVSGVPLFVPFLATPESYDFKV
jgi:hypothetical protein